MRRLFAVMCLAVILSGCAFHRVVTTAYLDPSSPAFGPGTTFAVMENSEASNVIFDRELKTKIIALLRARGFETASAESAEYRIQYQYGVEGRAVTTDRPVTHAGAQYYVHGGAGRSYMVRGSDYVTYVPEVHTMYTSRIGLAVTPRGKTDPVWIGDTHSETLSPDLREEVNYLLAASFRFFGQNTPKQQRVTIAPDDPAVVTLESAVHHVQRGTSDGTSA